MGVIPIVTFDDGLPCRLLLVFFLHDFLDGFRFLHWVVRSIHGRRLVFFVGIDGLNDAVGRVGIDRPFGVFSIVVAIRFFDVNLLNLFLFIEFFAVFVFVVLRQTNMLNLSYQFLEPLSTVRRLGDI